MINSFSLGCFKITCRYASIQQGFTKPWCPSSPFYKSSNKHIPHFSRQRLWIHSRLSFVCYRRLRCPMTNCNLLKPNPFLASTPSWCFAVNNSLAKTTGDVIPNSSHKFHTVPHLLSNKFFFSCFFSFF